MITVYIFKPIGERARRGLSNCCFSNSLESKCENEEVYKTILVSQEEYQFMVALWDDCLDGGHEPQIYLPRRAA